MNSGKLIVISGFSGAGKGTVIKRLLSEYPNYVLSISATTRKPRAGEEHGREYFFKTVDEFKSMIDNNELVEYAQYVGNYYGTPKEYVDKQLSEGKNVILEIEIQGALNIKKQFKDAVLVFITPPSAAELKNRLVNRGTEDLDTIMARLRRAEEEAAGVENYDYIIINDTIDKCVFDINSVIIAESNKSNNKLDIIEDIKENLKDI
ncbi:MAG: guanylate kinase [Lachnospiraceae bacterium]|nr:guanylate kinase [Lachnospiraceae bacterium]